MKRQILLYSIIAMGMAAWADALSPEQALARALSDADIPMGSRAHGDFALSHTFRFQSDPIGYMFTTGQNGFMLVSADDEATPVLGYSDTQRFDADSIPDGLRYWLDYYAHELQRARACGAHVEGKQSRAEMSREADRAPITPLLTTMWNQDAPYNDQCPIVQNRRSVTGCLATAMAQVMNYYKYPQKGSGYVKYKIDVTTDAQGNVTGGTDWEYDFTNTTFDWANMLDTYNGTATDVEKKAVATLMSACGASLQMGYSPVASNAYSSYAPQALIMYFGYSNTAHTALREYYTLEQWETLVYDQLKANGPLLYGGQSDTDGHAFVCDGYSGDGYFHFNWGWGGLSDGYFRLSALDPLMQGIGGSSSGFNFQQDIICDLRPAEGGDRAYKVVLGSPFEIAEPTAKVGASITWGKDLVNISAFALKQCLLNLAFEPIDGGAVEYALAASLPEWNAPSANGGLWSLSTVGTTIPMLSEGDYKVYPVWRLSSGAKGWNPLPCPIYGSAYYTAKVKKNNVTFVPETKTMPVISDVEIDPLYIDQMFRLTAMVQNDGQSEYYGRVEAVIVSNDGASLLYESTPCMIDLLPGKNTEIEILSDFKPEDDYTGEAKLLIVDMLSGNQIGESYDVVIKKLEAATEISVGTIEFGDGYGEVQDADDLCFKANVSCTSGYFGDVLYMYIFPYVPGQQVQSEWYLVSDFVSIEAGESRDAVFKGSFANGTDGEQYVVAIFINEVQYGGKGLVFKLKNKSSAIEDITGDEKERILYDLNGRRVKAGSAPRGLYISKPAGGGKAQKVVVK